MSGQLGIFAKLAWRNIFRNARRTIIAGSAIGVGLAALIVADAFILGMEHNLIASATESFMGEGQIHGRGFRETLEVEETIHNLDSVVTRLESDSLVRSYAPRTMSYVMISSPANMQSVSMIGVDPAREPELSQIDEALQQGHYFEGDNQRNILIGSELAEILEVELGDRIVVTAAQAHTGDLIQEMFRISGIYEFNVTDMDRGMAFVRIDKSREMLNLPGQAHQVALNMTDLSIGRNPDHPFWEEYTDKHNEALPWVRIMPQLAGALEMTSFSTWIIGLVLFGVVTLGIINTLFMSLYERMFEFGVMRAVGTRPFGIGRLVVFEAGALALISLIIGIILGAAVSAILSHYGVDYSGIEFAGVTFRERLYAVMDTHQYIQYPIVVFLFTCLVGLYPAVYAARMKAAEAMRRSL
jgi:ABC-type lipoprotein release transport system permease subunit